MKSAGETLMEDRPVTVMQAQNSTGGPIGSILFHVHEDDGLESRLQAALSLARACSAHLQLLHVTPIEAYTVVDSYGGTFVNSEIVEALEQDARKLRRRLEDHLGKEDVSWGYDEITSSAVAQLVRQGALSDLIFTGRLPRTREFTRSGPSLIGQLLYAARTPICIPGDDSAGFDPFGTAFIAWNGSIEAANAVRSSIGMLKLASEVRVVRYSEDKETAFPDTSLLEYLSRHGVPAVLDERVARADFVDDLIEYARLYSAQYLVMGAYSHSRAGEFVFGGVTRALLHACPVTLIMAH